MVLIGIGYTNVANYAFFYHKALTGSTVGALYFHAGYIPTQLSVTDGQSFGIVRHEIEFYSKMFFFDKLIH